MYSHMTGFEWDQWNKDKNWDKHGVSSEEAEQVFINQSVRIYKDAKHSQTEDRYSALGKTLNGRHLYIAFTVRNELIRIISARPMSKKERKLYENEQQNS